MTKILKETERAEVDKIVDDVAEQFRQILQSELIAERNEEITKVTKKIFQLLYEL